MLARIVFVLIQLIAKCYVSPMATTLSTSLQTLSLQTLSLQTLPDDIQQRVLAGVPLDDHQATASACKAFRAIIRGPGFLALRQRHGFAERVVVVVGNTCIMPACTTAESSYSWKTEAHLREPPTALGPPTKAPRLLVLLYLGCWPPSIMFPHPSSSARII